jgi:hypothetical protein
VTPERWRQINDLFHAVVERDAPTRQQILDAAASTDPELASEVRSLLAVHDSSGEILEQPAWAVAPELILGNETTLPPGTIKGSYRIVRELGRGGMGVVYEAEDTRLRRLVALKSLPSQYTNDPIRRERLTREARAAAALSHPAIATIHALEELDGELYLVSELVRGRTLREELRAGALPSDRLLPILIQLASGLAAAHAAGIVHRDFKPENIVQCDDGRVKILDFGLAHTLDPEGPTEMRLTQAGVAIGTPGYMSPEQLGGDIVDARTDVFAFGVVAWELATGRHPFGTSAAELLARATDVLDSESSAAVTAVMPIPGLDAILRKTLRRNRADRYESAAPLLADLERLTAPTRATAATPVARSPQAMWWWQMHQTSIAIVVASMPIAAWFLRAWGGAIGSKAFLIVLALSIISVTIRMNLLFTSRVHPNRLAAQRARVYTPLAAVEALLGVVLLLAAALVAGPHDALAAVLVGLAVITLASLGVIEPATTSAALPEN